MFCSYVGCQVLISAHVNKHIEFFHSENYTINEILILYVIATEKGKLEAFINFPSVNQK